MSAKFCPQRKLLIFKLLLSSILILSLGITTTAIAAYKPPPTPSRPKGPTGSNSTRTNGCTGNSQTSFTILAPLGHTGRTVSSQPTFVWFVPDSEPQEIQFSLYESAPNGKGKLIERVTLQSSPGINKYSLTKEKSTLSVGQKYIWQVVLMCDPNHPSEALVASTEIEVTATPSSLKTQLSQIKDPLKRADLYAKAGFWYDALGEIIEEPKHKAYGLKLLSKLSQLETASANNAEPKVKKALLEQADQLQKIVNFEQQRK